MGTPGLNVPSSRIVAVRPLYRMENTTRLAATLAWFTNVIATPLTSGPGLPRHLDAAALHAHRRGERFPSQTGIGGRRHTRSFCERRPLHPHREVQLRFGKKTAA